MISFGKIWTACVCINIAILLVNYAGVFPEHWSYNLNGINESYHSINKQLSSTSKFDPSKLLTSGGSWGWVLFKGVLLALQVVLLAPVYTGQTIDNFLSACGVPAPIGLAFTIISYLSFIFWVVDVFRGRSISD